MPDKSVKVMQESSGRIKRTFYVRMEDKMKIDRLKAVGIDYEEGLERFSGNEQLYIKYLNKLLTVDTYEKMREAALAGEIQEAFAAAHKLKAFIGNLSISHFYDKIKNLTEEFRAGVARDYGPDFEKLDLEYEKILQAIRSMENA